MPFRPGIMLVRESVKLKQQTELDRFIANERQRLTAQSAEDCRGHSRAERRFSVRYEAAGGAEQQVLALRLQQLEATASRIELGRVIVRLDSIERLGRDGRRYHSGIAGSDAPMPTPPQTVGIIGSVKSPSTVVYRSGVGYERLLQTSRRDNGRCQ